VLSLEKIPLIMLLRLKTVFTQVLRFIVRLAFDDNMTDLLLLLVAVPDGTVQWFDIGWVVVENKLGERHTAACPGKC
jgi:hypothetical protein